MTITSSGIKIQKYSPNLGAIITGVDLSQEINEEQFKDIHKAFLDNQVLFFQNQNEILPEIRKSHRNNRHKLGSTDPPQLNNHEEV